MKLFGLSALLLFCSSLCAQLPFNGIETDLNNLFRVSNAKSRAICPENPTGGAAQGGKATDGPGAIYARDLGPGWKIRPYITIKSKTTVTLAEINGCGAVQHIWITPFPTGIWRFMIIRMYWDDETVPSVEVPLGDFFGMGWGVYTPLNSLAVCVNPQSAFNCYWPMPFRKKCRITLENIGDNDIKKMFYQVDYILTDIPSDAAYFHAQFRRVNPLPYKQNYVIVDSIKGKGQYVGTYMAWGVHNNGWWGEGEVKFYMDGDTGYPTICGTGTEDYFCGSYDFDTKTKNASGVIENHYTQFSSPYSGLVQVIQGDGHYNAQQRFGLYRWHIRDPVRFDTGLKVTIQALGWTAWASDELSKYLPLRDDISSVAFWYQIEPHTPFPPLPSKDELEIN